MQMEMVNGHGRKNAGERRELIPARPILINEEMKKKRL